MMSRSIWIILGLILVLTVTSYFYSKKKDIPPWMKCKESLFSQVVFKKCTPSMMSSPRIDFENEENKELQDLPYEEPQN